MGVRLMVVDDHRLLAEALASALKLRGHRVLAAAAPTSGAAELVVSRAPEVCLFGTASPAAPGVFDPITRIGQERPQVAVVVLGPVPSPRGIAAAFAAGAVGYVRHDERIEGVERSMLKARAGESAIAPQLLRGPSPSCSTRWPSPTTRGGGCCGCSPRARPRCWYGSPRVRAPG